MYREETTHTPQKHRGAHRHNAQLAHRASQGGIIHGIRIRIPYYTYLYLFCCIICSYSCWPFLRRRLRLRPGVRLERPRVHRTQRCRRGGSQRDAREDRHPAQGAPTLSNTHFSPRSASAVAHTPDVEWSSGTRMSYQVLYVYRRQYRQYEHLCVLDIIHISFV